ncbi:MAG: hypothetical protein U9R29_06540 [Thermodesulfobacteriota bacterium]|nr:hypothetical protein [Thermodesulfobacteriota bacterium]
MRNILRYLRGRTTSRSGLNVSRLADESGQSTIEYILVCSILIGALLKGPHVYNNLITTMENKYHSYAFSVAISDPPRKAFDDEIRKDATKIEHVLDVLEEIEDDIERAHIPDPSDIHIPKGIEEMWDKITHLI